MGQATRTTTLLLDLAPRKQGGANPGKRAALDETVRLLTAARAFSVEFFLAHPGKLLERVEVVSSRTGEAEERLISADKLLSWAEAQTVETRDHPESLPGWNFTKRFPDLPYQYRRSVIKDAIGKVRGYLSHLTAWQASGKRKGKPGRPGAADHPTLYQGTFRLDLEDPEPVRDRFVRLKVFTGQQWTWNNFPAKISRYFQRRLTAPDWQTQSPALVVRKGQVALHFPQVKTVRAKKVVESKRDPELITLGVDLNVKNLAVVTVRKAQRIIETVFLTDHGLDQARYRHLKQIARKQWQTGKAIKGGHSNQDLWRHVRRMNEDAARKVAASLARLCARYPGAVLLFERLRTIAPQGGSQSRRRNRRQANQLRGKIRQYAAEKAYAESATVTVEVNPHGTSQYCPRCGAKGERFSVLGGKTVAVKWGKLFRCRACGYEANADFCASVNVHRSFYREGHWAWHKPKPHSIAPPG